MEDAESAAGSQVGDGKGTPLRSGAATRQKLLDAARAILLEQGHQSATVKEIARKAGVNHGLVHHYFRSKEHLFVDLLDCEETYQNDELKKALHSQESAVNYLGAHLVDTARFRVEFHSLAMEMPEVRDRLKGYIESTRSMLKETLSIEDEAQVALLVAATSGIVLHSMLDEDLPVHDMIGILYRMAGQFREDSIG